MYTLMVSFVVVRFDLFFCPCYVYSLLKLDYVRHKSLVFCCILYVSTIVLSYSLCVCKLNDLIKAMHPNKCYSIYFLKT